MRWGWERNVVVVAADWYFLIFADNTLRWRLSTALGLPGWAWLDWSTCLPWAAAPHLTSPPPSPSPRARAQATTPPSLTSPSRRPSSPSPPCPPPTPSLPSWRVPGSPPRPPTSTPPATPGPRPPLSQPSGCSRHSRPWPTPPSPSPPPPSSPPPPPPTTPPPTPPARTSPPPTARSLCWPPRSLATVWCTASLRSVRPTPGCRPPPPPPPPPSSPPTPGPTPGQHRPGSASSPGWASSSCCPARTRPGRRWRSWAGRTRLQWRLTPGTRTDTLLTGWQLSRWVPGCFFCFFFQQIQGKL